MKVLVLEGSPHRKGTTRRLAEEFIRGAKEKGHLVEEIDVAHSAIRPCLGCGSCGMDGECVQKDEGNRVLGKILESDCLVFVTPVYYFGMSAQLKAFVDRFYARNEAITRKHLKVVWIAAAWNDDDTVMKALEEHISILDSYLGMEEAGRVLARGAGYPEAIRKEYLEQAYLLGKNL